MTDDEMKLNIKRQLEAWKRCDGFEFSDYELEMCKRYNVDPHYSDEERKHDRDMELEIFKRYNIKHTDYQPETYNFWDKDFIVVLVIPAIAAIITSWGWVTILNS